MQQYAMGGNKSKPPQFDNVRNAKDAQELSDSCSSNGVAAAIRLLTAKANEWREQPLEIAVIGQSGAGKSSYINAVRNVAIGHEKFASVGCTQTTFTCTKYEHPSNKHVIFWDVPGVGTEEYPKETYLEQVDIDRYDAYLILSIKRFTELDGWLAKEIRARGKKFYFIRTHIDDDVRNEKRAKQQIKEETLKCIRNDIQQNLRKFDFSDPPIFLIDSYETSQYEFSELGKCVAQDLPDLKREALVLTLESASKTVIELKVAELRSRAWKMAILSASAATIPEPGFSMAVDFAILVEEAQFYLHQFGLDDASLTKRAENSFSNADAVISMVRQEIPAEIGVQYLKELLLVGAVALGEVVEEVVRFIPVVGKIIAAPISLAATKYCLDNIITKMSEMSLRVLLQTRNSEV